MGWVNSYIVKVVTNIERCSISAEEMQKECVKLFNICHSKMEEIVPENSRVRLNSMTRCNIVMNLL